jgi:hypothetical protein
MPFVRSFVFSIVVVSGALLGGCGGGLPGKVAFIGQSATLQSGVQVNFQDAWAHAGETKVKLWVANMTQAFMQVNRDGFALRLPDGRVVPRTGAVHNIYTLPPGGGHEVIVEFRDPGYDMRANQQFSLIVGGISFNTDPRVRAVGEVPLVATGPHR